MVCNLRLYNEPGVLKDLIGSFQNPSKTRKSYQGSSGTEVILRSCRMYVDLGIETGSR